MWGQGGGSIRSALEMQRVKGERVWMLFLGTTFSTHDLVLRKIIWRIKKEKKKCERFVLYSKPHKADSAPPPQTKVCTDICSNNDWCKQRTKECRTNSEPKHVQRRKLTFQFDLCGSCGAFHAKSHTNNGYTATPSPLNLSLFNLQSHR